MQNLHLGSGNTFLIYVRLSQKRIDIAPLTDGRIFWGDEQKSRWLLLRCYCNLNQNNRD